jgi:hypothetical protein
MKLTNTVWSTGNRLAGSDERLVGAKTDGGGCAVCEKGHEYDLNRPSCPVQKVFFWAGDRYLSAHVSILPLSFWPV